MSQGGSNSEGYMSPSANFCLERAQEGLGLSKEVPEQVSQFLILLALSHDSPQVPPAGIEEGCRKSWDFSDLSGELFPLIADLSLPIISDRWEPLWASCVFRRSRSSKAISHVALGAEPWSPAGWASSPSPLAAASQLTGTLPCMHQAAQQCCVTSWCSWETWGAFARQNAFASEGTETSKDPNDEQLERLTVFLSSLSLLAAMLASTQTRACSQQEPRGRRGKEMHGSSSRATWKVLDIIF